MHDVKLKAPTNDCEISRSTCLVQHRFGPAHILPGVFKLGASNVQTANVLSRALKTEHTDHAERHGIIQTLQF